MGGMLSRREASGEHGNHHGVSHADPRLRRVTACHPTDSLPLRKRVKNMVGVTASGTDHARAIYALSNFPSP